MGRDLSPLSRQRHMPAKVVRREADSSTGNPQTRLLEKAVAARWLD
ncbi:MAG: hypothetical protein IPL28_13210 [Chloroflexi bacterium]|nr:hypothetical protein [Chloroflexota bacterium]